jgi:isoquinoline 1-oxidoreductase
MENRNHSRHPYEPSTGELPPKPRYRFRLNRRKFFKLTGGGLVVAFVLQDLFSRGSNDIYSADKTQPDGVDAWIHIGEDGTVKVFTGKVEVGQNIRTSLSQIVAEELMVPMSSVTMIMGDTDLVPYDAGTFGSRSTPQMGTQLRRASATAREALKGLAAKKWNTTPASLNAEDGMIINTATREKVNYGSLTEGKQLLMKISDNVPVIAAKDWKVAGKSMPKVDQMDFISGRHMYVSDMKITGMLYGKILRPPSYGAKLIEANLTNAQRMPGVIVVKDGDFVGVAAPDSQTAKKALLAIDTKWEERTDQPSNANIFEYLMKDGTDEKEDNKTTGDVENGLSGAAFKYSNTYNINYIAHVPLEPRAALAQWTDGKLTVWTGTQRPFGVQEQLAETFRLNKEKIRVIMPDTGSGYGGKHTGEAAIEAARLAQEAKAPVKVVWTREEEFTWAYFRPGGVIKVDAGVNKDGSITAWKFVNYNSGGAGLDTQYKASSKQIAHIPSNTPLKQGSYRGLAATANVFARECSMTDLARLIALDPLEFRLKNLDDDRFITVLQTAAKSFGWTNPKTAGHGYGIAGGFEKGGHVATCVEVMVNSDKEVKVLRVIQAFEVGAIVNPHHLENQAIGSIIMGLGGALFEAVQFADGKILNAGLSVYRVPRFRDVPKIEIILLDRKDLPSAGAGEAAIIGVAPAIRNAILDAAGTALNTLPMIPNGITG